MIADLETPVSAMIKLVGGAPNSFFLESVEGGSIRGRYSFLGMQPDLIWRCHGNQAEINRGALENPGAFQPCPVSEDAGTLASFRSVLAESRIDLPPGLPPMAAGLFGYMGYDVVRLAEDIPDNNPKNRDGAGRPVYAPDHHHCLRYHRRSGDNSDAGLARREHVRRASL
jgi:anthranilate synthase component 1